MSCGIWGLVVIRLPNLRRGEAANSSGARRVVAAGARGGRKVGGAKLSMASRPGVGRGGYVQVLMTEKKKKRNEIGPSAGGDRVSRGRQLTLDSSAIALGRGNRIVR